MVRRFDEPIQVQVVAGAATGVGGVAGGVEGTEGAGSAGGAEGASPTAFLWRGRVYAVRAVDAQWSERRAWWRTGSGDAHPREGRLGNAHPGEGRLGNAHPGDGSVVTAPAQAPVTAGDRRIWRVRAQVGRAGVAGIYELAHDGCAAEPWRLVSAHD